jgi:hypothetical protein
MKHFPYLKEELLLFTVIVVVVVCIVIVFNMTDRLRFSRLRRERQRKGITREQFVGGFSTLSIPENIPTTVLDYYKAFKVWQDFPFTPDDEYSGLLNITPEDIEGDAKALVERLGMQFLPEYIRRDYGDRPIKTLRDMVLWLDWMRQHQPTTTGASEPSSKSA